MTRLDDTSLHPDERALLSRFAELLAEWLGPQLHAIWLYGSRARAEALSHEDSDVDALVLVDDDSWEGKEVVYSALDEAAREIDLISLSFSFSVHVQTPAWLEGRRAIKSFFVQKVDRDKVVVAGSAYESSLS